MPAFAGSAYSSTASSSANNYVHRSQIVTNSSSGTARSEVGPQHTSRPTGELGGRGRAYNSSNTLISQSGWSYSNQTLPPGAFWGNTATFSGNGSYYSQGQVQVWNGNGYTTYTTLRTVNQSIPG